MSGSVLIVDDDDMTSALIAEVLRDEGFTVTHLGNTTSNAIRAAVNRLKPDVVLLDGSDRLGFGDSLGRSNSTLGPHVCVDTCASVGAV